MGDLPAILGGKRSAQAKTASARDGMAAYSNPPVLKREDSAAPILTATGEGYGVVLAFRGITEKKRTEKETKQQKELLQLILASIADGVVVADSNGKFPLFNVAAEQVLGIGATETTPGKWSDQYGVYSSDTVTQYFAAQLPLVRATRGENVDAVELFIRDSQVPIGRLFSYTYSNKVIYTDASQRRGRRLFG